MIDIQFDECCPLCHEEIILQLEAGFGAEEYVCDCGARITVEFEGTLSMKTRNGKRRATSVGKDDRPSTTHTMEKK